MIYLAVFVLLLLVLAIPLQLTFSVEKREHWRARVIVRGLLGLMRVGLSLPRSRRRRHRRARREPATGATSSPAGRRLIAALRSEGFRAHLWKFLGRLNRALHPRHVRIVLRFGMDDPADTGLAMGFLAPFFLFSGSFGVGPASRSGVELHPDFTGAGLRGYGRASVRFVPLRVAGLLFGFLVSPPTLRAMKAAFRARAT